MKTSIRDKRLKIVLISEKYPPESYGGTEIFYQILAQALAALGHDVRIIIKCTDYPRVDFINGVWIHRIAFNIHKNRQFPFLPPEISPFLKDKAYSIYDTVKCIQVEHGLDVVFSHLWEHLGIACSADKSLLSVLTLQTTYKIGILFDATPNFDDPAHNFLSKWNLENSTYLLGNSISVLKDTQQAYNIRFNPGSYSYIPHGIENMPECRLENNTKNPISPVHLLFVGRFEYRKGIDVFLEILPKLLKRYDFLQVTLVGLFPVNFNDLCCNVVDSFVKAQAGADFLNRIIFTNVIPNDELLQHYQNCDLFVLPSRYESFGLAYLEAMRFGKPCIGTHVGGIPEVVSNGETGLLANPGDAGDLYEKVCLLISNPELRRTMGKKGRRQFLEKFTSEIMAKNFVDLIHHLEQI